MKALVTGACGFVGGYLIRHLLECNDEVIGTFLVDPRAGHGSVGAPIERIRLDVTDQHATIQQVQRVKPDVIYHLAGIAFVPEAEEDFDKALRVNVGAVNNVIRGIHLIKHRARVVFVSSAEVYGKIKQRDLPITEETPTRPINNYSASKLMAEIIASRYTEGGYADTVVVRPFNHIGPGQNDRFVASNFAKQLARIKVGKAEPVIRVGNLDAKRDFSDVRDVVRAYRLAAVKGQGTYNFGSGHSTVVKEILETLVRISGVQVKVEYDPARMRPSEIPEVYGSCEKAWRELGWRPEIKLEDTLRDIYAFELEELRR